MTKAYKKNFEFMKEVFDTLCIIAPIDNKYFPPTFQHDPYDNRQGIRASAYVEMNKIYVYNHGLGKIDFYLSAYPSEEEFIRKYVTTDKKFRTWLICHEYAHILNPSMKHTKKFFEKVEGLYLEYVKYIKHQGIMSNEDYWEEYWETLDFDYLDIEYER